MGTSVPNAPICYFPEDRGYKMTGMFMETVTFSAGGSQIYWGPKFLERKMEGGHKI